MSKSVLSRLNNTYISAQKVFKEINDAINEKLGTENEYLPSQMSQAIRDIHTNDKEDNFFSWLSHFQISPYAKTGDTLKITIPKYAQNTSKAFNGVWEKGVDYTTLIVDKEDEENYPVKNMADWFYCNRNTKVLYLNFDTSKVNSFGDSWCEYYSTLTYVYGKPIDLSSCDFIENSFNCSSLQIITFVPGSIKKRIKLYRCSKLTADSVSSIIEGLTDLTGQTSLYLFLNDTVKNKLSVEQIASITSKNWILG